MANKENDVNIGWPNGFTPGPMYLWPSYNRLEFTKEEIKPIPLTIDDLDSEIGFGEYVTVKLDNDVNTFKINVIPMGNSIDSLNQDAVNNIAVIYNSNGIKLNNTDINTLPHGIYLIVRNNKVSKYIK